MYFDGDIHQSSVTAFGQPGVSGSSWAPAVNPTCPGEGLATAWTRRLTKGISIHPPWSVFLSTIASPFVYLFPRLNTKRKSTTAGKIWIGQSGEFMQTPLFFFSFLNVGLVIKLSLSVQRLIKCDSFPIGPEMLMKEVIIRSTLTDSNCTSWEPG